MEVRESTFTVRTYDCRADGKIRVASLMQYLQEAAALHAEELGFGFEKLDEMNCCWVLSNFKIEIVRLPMWRDRITIKTWPSGCNRVIATREFVGQDQDKRELFRAGSEWMILDKQKNRPRNLLRFDLDLPQTGEKVFSDELGRLQPSGEYQEVDRVHVPYSAIDMNGHVNNTEYVRWGLDALRKAFKTEGQFQSMQINYMSEVFEGDKLDLLVSTGVDGHFHILGRKSETNTDVYMMEVRKFVVTP